MRVGNGRVREIAEVCKQYHISAPLLVTDPGIAALPMTEQITNCCTQAGLSIHVFSDVRSNPTGSNVESGTRAYLEGSHDGIIALGGGSALDAGKAIAVAVNQACTIWDLEDIGDNWTSADASKIPSVIAIPTTAGTGSEVGRAAVILNQDEQRKVIVFHPLMCPDCVILDPALTLGLPPGLTAATGMDALSHNLEAYCSPVFHPMAAGVAVEGIRLIKTFLPIAVDHGTDLDARLHMLTASSMGATAFQRGLGAMHALSHPLGALYDAHHGTLNAILMPYVLIANRRVIHELIKTLSQYLDISGGFDSFMDWVLALRKEINIPHTLQDIGIDEARMAEIGQMAVTDPSSATNPILFTEEQYSEIGTRAVQGRL